MEWWHALILGIVEGLTEYLPVSSTGHLLLTQRLLGIESGEAADAFAICIQAGAIVAVLGLYFRRIQEILLGLLGKSPNGLRLAINIVVAFIPAAIAGLLLNKPIKKYLFGGDAWGMWPVVLAWFIGGVAILVAIRMRRRKTGNTHIGLDLTQLTWKMAVIIGLCQCIAMWPGVSRSLVTIVSGVMVGLSLTAAVEFSFLLGVLTLGAATAHDALEYGPAMLESYGALPLLIGTLAAWGSAVIAVRWMVAYLEKHGMGIFGYYRIALALVVTILLLSSHA